MAEEPQFIRRRSASKAGWRRIGKLEKDIMWDSKMAEPPGGFPSVKKVRFPTSNWDWESWPESNHPIAEILPKGRAQKRFLLNDNDIVDLCYTLHEIYVPNAAYRHLTAHKYLCIQLERRSWEKYGGPSGFEAALAKKNAENPPANARGGRGRGRGRGAAANVAPRGRKAARGQDAHPNGQPPQADLPPAALPPTEQAAAAERIAEPRTPKRRARPQRRHSSAGPDFASESDSDARAAHPGPSTPRQSSGISPQLRRILAIEPSTKERQPRTPATARRVVSQPAAFPDIGPLMGDVSESEYLEPEPSTSTHRTINTHSPRKKNIVMDDSDLENPFILNPSKSTPLRKIRTPRKDSEVLDLTGIDLDDSPSRRPETSSPVAQRGGGGKRINDIDSDSDVKIVSFSPKKSTSTSPKKRRKVDIEVDGDKEVIVLSDY